MNRSGNIKRVVLGSAWAEGDSGVSQSQRKISAVLETTRQRSLMRRYDDDWRQQRCDGQARTRMEKPSMIFARSSRRCAPGAPILHSGRHPRGGLWRADAVNQLGTVTVPRADAPGDFAVGPERVPLIDKAIARPTWD